MNYDEIARSILENIGGNENIISIMSCFTRVRIEVKEKDKVNEDMIKKLDGVKGATFFNNTYQIIFGGKCNDVYDALAKIVTIKEEQIIILGRIDFIGYILYPNRFECRLRTAYLPDRLYKGLSSSSSSAAHYSLDAVYPAHAASDTGKFFFLITFLIHGIDSATVLACPFTFEHPRHSASVDYPTRCIPISCMFLQIFCCDAL